MKNESQKFENGGSSNTPLHSTEREPLEACVDWFSATFEGNVFMKGLCSMLHLSVEDFESKELASTNEYDYLYNYSGIIMIMTRNDNAQGTKKALTHIDIKGQGCRFLENNWTDGVTWVDFFNLLKTCFTLHHITRLDVAIDDYKGFLNITTLHRKMRLKHFRSSAGTRSWRYIESGDIQSGQEIDGQTLYIGKGDVEFRFYDKKGQLENNKKIDLDSDVEFWNRYEIQLRQDRALAVMDMIAQGRLEVGELVRSIMCEYLTFLVEHKTDTNKSRWAVCGWWSQFLGGVSGTKLTMQPLEKSVYKTQNWVEKQVSVSLAILDECLNDNGYYMKSLIADGQKRMTKQHRQMIKQFRISENFRDTVKKQSKKELREMSPKLGTIQSVESSDRNWARLQGERFDNYE